MEIVYFTEDEYSKSYTELLEILKNFSKSDIEKIPKNVIYKYIKERNENYQFVYDKETGFEKISKLTKILLANIYIDYLATEEEREQIRANDQIELSKNWSQSYPKYNNNLKFNDYKTNNQLVVVEKKNFFKKLLEKIRKIFT